MGEKIVPLELNLVRYSNPVSVTEREEKLPNKKLDGKDGGLISNETINECDEILNCLFPPREWEENGKRWRQNVWNQPATRKDVIELTEMLDTGLQHLRARATRICPIRSALHSQCFDEIIRQVTIDCAERGLLLLKVRDELQMTMDAYKTFYEGSKAFAMGKSLSAEHNELANMRDRLTELEAEKQKYKDDLATAIAKYEIAQRLETERRIAEQQTHSEEIDFLKRSNQQLKAQLKGLTAPPKI